MNQPGPAMQPDPAIIPVQTGGAPLPPAQAGGVPAPPVQTGGATVGTAVLMPHAHHTDDSLQNILDNLDLNDPPSFCVNLPYLFPLSSPGTDITKAEENQRG